jgi:hypothetical protein
MRDPNNDRQYTVDVPVAEAIAQQIYTICDDHRARYSEEWFTEQPDIVHQG